MPDTPTADQTIAWYDTLRRRDTYVTDAARYLYDDLPRRIRLAHRLAALVYGTAAKLPDRLAWRIFRGWDNALDQPFATTICRLLGHAWTLIVPGAPRRGIGHLLMCEGCHTTASTDDPDMFEPGSRARRDLAVWGFELDGASDTARYCFPWPPREEAHRA